mgnify:CR=1 FL=1
MTDRATFVSASPYQEDVLALPVTDLDAASAWYAEHFGMTEVERRDGPPAAVVLERDGVRIGFATTGGDPAQDGAALEVSGIGALRQELESKGIATANWRVDERDGRRFQVFFVVAPDGLCYYLYEPLEES